MNESQAIESNATQVVCAQCGSRLSSTDGADKVCINCLLRVVLDQDDVEPFKPGSGEVSAKSPWWSGLCDNGDLHVVDPVTIIGGTGRYAGARGSFTLDQCVNLVTGETSGTISGTIVVRGQ
jgi:hypothetical protein